MEKFELIEIGKGDVIKEWSLINTIETENGFENPRFGCSLEEYKNEVMPKWQKDSQGIDLPKGYVPQTSFILYVDGTPVGLYKVRHFCNEVTRVNGAGHIGYGIKKEYRGHGYATEGLKLAIKELINMPDYDHDGVIMGYHKDNPASGKVQAKCGAVVVGETEQDYITKIEIK